MLIEILSHTPLWVWGLLTALVALGLSQRQTRQVAPARLLVLPIVMLLLGLNSLAGALTAMPALTLVWLAALAVGAAGGLRLPVPAGTRWDAVSARLHLPGSWLPLLLILVIFLLRYTAAVALALNPVWRADAAVQVPLSLVFGLLSGLFLGRALGLRRLATIGINASSASPARA